jgi:tRNA pseudouridine38-40 synthase
MTVWKSILTYDGGPYHGWQVQPGLTTVQGTLAEALARITGESVLPQGSGRTDTGVHALGQVASFALEAPIPAENLHRALNRALPTSIRVINVLPMPDGFHARHSAQRKTYEYRIRPGSGSEPCSPFLARWVWDCPWPLDLPAMQDAAARVIGTHDFSSFAASDPDRATRENGKEETGCVRTIFCSCWSQRAGLLVYRVTGSGFLHHMVRNLVGTFVDVGAGRRKSNDIKGILAVRERAAAGATAPAQGLFLVDVDYGEVRA